MYRKNHFSHLTEDEFKRFYLRTHVHIDKNAHQLPHNANYKELPLTVDWRSKGVVNPVKNQKKCGSCWAFAVVATIETSVALNQGQLLELSEQQFIDCDSYDYGCNGGSVDGGLQFAKNHSLCDSKYTYTAMTGKCLDCSPVVRVTNSYIYGNVEAMMQGIQRGVLLAHIDASKLQYYGGGIIDDTVKCQTNLNHAVAIVGYGEENGAKYWIVRNSWGSDWGEKGYFRITRGTNKCGIEMYSYGVDAKQL